MAGSALPFTFETLTNEIRGNDVAVTPTTATSQIPVRWAQAKL